MPSSANRSQPAHVCVVDDDEMVRTSLCMLLEVLGMRVSTYPDAATFLADPRALGCDVLLLDVRMPGMSGLQLQALLNQRHADVPILFLSGHANIPTAVGAMRAGALDFLQKPFDEQQLIGWIQTSVQRRQASRSHDQEVRAVRQRQASLTAREQDLLDAVLAGKPNKLIAAELGISLKTVEQHRGRMMAKMQARKVADLFRMLHLVEPVALATTS